MPIPVHALALLLRHVLSRIGTQDAGQDRIQREWGQFDSQRARERFHRSIDARSNHLCLAELQRIAGGKNQMVEGAQLLKKVSNRLRVPKSTGELSELARRCLKR